MDARVFRSFAEEIKVANLTPGLIERGAQALMRGGPRAAMPKVPTVPRVGSFGISTVTKTSSSTSKSTSGEHEGMTRAKWVQTAKDLPLVIAATGVGHGVGKTVGDAIIKNQLKHDRPPPKWMKHAPLASSVLSSVGSYALGRSRAIQKERREEAEARARSKLSGVEPAPQSRRIPRKEWSDPWRYDPRPAGIFGP